MRERLRWLGYGLWTKDDRLTKIILVCQLSRGKRKAYCPRLGWEDVKKKVLKEMENSKESVKREALNRLGWKRMMRLGMNWDGKLDFSGLMLH